MKVATFFLVAAPLLSPRPAFGRLIGDQNRRLRTACGVDSDCATDACSTASCVSSVCEYEDQCAGVVFAATAPDANGNCGKASCNINGACTVLDVTTGCRDEDCDPCTGGCNAVTGCCDVRNPCDGIPCYTGECIPVAGGGFTCPKKECKANEGNDCILDECKDTGGGTPEDGECRELYVAQGQLCETTVAGSQVFGTCDAGNCDVACTEGTVDCNDDDPCTLDICIINNGNTNGPYCLNEPKCTDWRLNPCIEDTCDGGTCDNMNVAAGTSCDSVVPSTCDGAGNCVVTIPPPPATEAPPEAATEAPPEAATEAPPEATTTPEETTPPPPTCGDPGKDCTVPSDCCSNKCKGRNGSKKCK